MKYLHTFKVHDVKDNPMKYLVVKDGESVVGEFTGSNALRHAKICAFALFNDPENWQ